MLTACVAALSTTPVIAGDRYATPPPLILSPDLASPWVLQLKVRQPLRGSVQPQGQRQAATRAPWQAPQQRQRQARPSDPFAQVAAVQVQKPKAKTLDPMYLPQRVAYNGSEAPGTIVISTSDRFLYLVEDGGEAMRYGVGVGKQGFSWSGTERISQKKEWPSWTPPAEMIAREKKKGRILPAHLKGGPDNPLGARALYLGSTLYRIHGTNQPWTIGGAVSSGCIRMRNEDVTELYTRVKVGTKVIVR